MIHLYHVSKVYPPRFTALSDVSLAIDAGEFVFLTGPSGAGKTTLLRLLLGAETPTAGQIVVGGRNLARLGRQGIAKLRRSTGMVFQDAKLLAGLPVLDNVALPAEAAGESSKEGRRRAFALLRELGLKDLVRRYPRSLSGGEQQRVALARALVNEPGLLLADEPTGNLDEESAHRVVELMVRAHSGGATVVLATHDPHLLRAVSGRQITLRAGHLVEGGAAAE
ncbi:MAG TPA: ATP-binding cassette domain-containing protein [Candidatus Binatia bacterium]|nr:ATP-binding cassette domain-containing protein [Candidatus Binatia bacterium]